METENFDFHGCVDGKIRNNGGVYHYVTSSWLELSAAWGSEVPQSHVALHTRGLTASTEYCGSRSLDFSTISGNETRERHRIKPALAANKGYCCLRG